MPAVITRPHALLFGSVGCEFFGTVGNKRVRGIIARVGLERGDDGREILHFYPKESWVAPFKFDPSFAKCTKDKSNYTIDTKIFGTFLICNVRT